MLTCLQAAAESPDVNMREGEWNATERRGRHTGVSEHSARGPMAEWCLRDKAEAYTPRRAPQGPLLPCRLSLPLYPCIASPSDQAVKDTLGDTRSTLAGCKTVFFWRMCWCGGAWRSRKKKNKGRHESSNCNSLVNSVQRPINMHLQMCCNTFLLRRWYYAAHVAQQLWISLIWWLLR